MDQAVIASFCAGEFGWEVAAWIPWLRGKAQGRDMVALCAPGHEALYEDFAVPRPVKHPWVVNRRLCCHAWREGERKPVPREDYVALAREVAPECEAASVLTPYELDRDLIPLGAGMWPLPVAGVRWHRYGPDLERDLVVVHARAHALSPERNWPEARLAELRPYLPPRVIAIGHPESAIVPPECEDLRGVEMRDLVRILARAEVVIGPSSGPLPLANLCGAPVIWWSPHRKDVRRFQSVWNPFGVQNVQAAASWEPAVQDVVSAFFSMEDRRAVA